MDKENKISPLNIAMLGHKTIPSRQGGIEIVVEELTSAWQKPMADCDKRSVVGLVPFIQKNIQKK